MSEDFEKDLRADLPRGLKTVKDRPLSAKWAGPEEMTGDVWQYRRGSLLLGKRNGKLIGWNDNRHIVTIAGSRAGKGVSLIIPNLIKYEGSAFVIDPKGENAAFTARRREQMGQAVYVLDPFGVSGCKTSSFNPLAELSLRDKDVIEDAGVFADALIEHPTQADRHWSESAQALIRALILLTLAHPKPYARNLVTVRKLLTLTDPWLDQRIKQEKFMHPVGYDYPKLMPQNALLALLREQKGKRHGDVCVGVAEQFAAMEGKELGSVLSTAKTQTQWLDDPRVKRALGYSKFKMADLKRKKTSIYLCLPAMRMGTHARWLRLMIMHALNVMERTREKPDMPVLFVLDEFPVLGYMKPIEVAAGLMAGYGVKLWTIIQNVGQLKQHYQQSWETFFANAGMVTAFGVVDSESQAEISKKLGKIRITSQVPTGAVGSALLQGSPSLKDERSVEPLLSDDEFGRLFSRERGRILMLGAGLDPAIAERLVYHAKAGPDAELFKGLYDNPF